MSDMSSNKLFQQYVAILVFGDVKLKFTTQINDSDFIIKYKEYEIMICVDDDVYLKIEEHTVIDSEDLLMYYTLVGRISLHISQYRKEFYNFLSDKIKSKKAD